MIDLFRPSLAGWCLSVALWRRWDRLDAALDHSRAHEGSCYWAQLLETATLVTEPERITLRAIARERGIA